MIFRKGNEHALCTTLSLFIFIFFPFQIYGCLFMYWKCQIYWIELEQICVPLYGSQKDTAVGWNIIFVPFYSWNWDAHLWTSFLVLLCRAWHVMVETKWEVMTITKWLFDRIQQSLCDRPYVMSVSWHDTYLVIILLLVSWNWSGRPTILNSQATLHVMFQYENKTYVPFHLEVEFKPKLHSCHVHMIIHTIMTKYVNLMTGELILFE